MNAYPTTTPHHTSSQKGAAPMHAVLVTFESAASLDELAAPFAAYAEAVRATPGLASKTWLNDGTTLGAFLLFADQASAERYLEGELFAGIKTNPAFQQLRIEHFTVLDELTAVTGGALAATVLA
jgi:quinol monooxygenase YgiN